MPEKPDLFKEELDQLSDQEIEARPAAAVWVDDKRAAVLRYLEEKKLGLKKAALSEKLEIARSAKEAAWAAVEERRTHSGRRKSHCLLQASRRRLSQQRLLRRSCLSETMKVAACPP
jgi:hypothetical protein